MTSQQILQSDFLDILFENRNKSYGAYSLRKNYPIELAKAIGIMLLLVGSLLFIGGSSENPLPRLEAIPDYNVSVVDMPKEIKPEPVQPRTTQPSAPKQFKTDVFTADQVLVDQTKDLVVTQSQLTTSIVGSTVVEGPAGPAGPPPTPPSAGGTGTGVETPAEKKDPPLPSRGPQFPGGTEAWANFLGKHLRPVQDLEPGEKRSCLIRFSVDEEGSVTNFAVVQSGGSEFDNEVIRVLKKMPKWLPAIQNGKPAAVSFTQPVTFVAQED